MQNASVILPSRQFENGWTINSAVVDSVFVVATDELRDLAIIKIKGVNLPALALGNSDALIVGEPVVIVGSPQGLEGTITAGILSSVRDSGDGYNVLQTDAAVNPGNSGGPLVNNKGQVVGVVSFKFRSSEGLNFAIPVSYVRGLLNNLHEPLTLDQMRRRLLTKSTSGQQPGGPTLAETLAWLREKLSVGLIQIVYYDKRNARTVSWSIQTKAWELESCTVTVGNEIMVGLQGGPANISSSQNSLALSSLTSGSVIGRDWEQEDSNERPFVSGDRWRYTVSLISESQDIVRHFSNSYSMNPSKSERVDRLVLCFPEEALARRVYEAFMHAASLCRVQKEPF
jgi:hypothetical protein